MTHEGRELDERELELVVGGGTDPVDPTPSTSNPVDADGKSTPILM